MDSIATRVKGTYHQILGFSNNPLSGGALFSTGKTLRCRHSKELMDAAEHSPWLVFDENYSLAKHPTNRRDIYIVTNVWSNLEPLRFFVGDRLDDEHIYNVSLSATVGKGEYGVPKNNSHKIQLVNKTPKKGLYFIKLSESFLRIPDYGEVPTQLMMVRFA